MWLVWLMAWSCIHIEIGAIRVDLNEKDSLNSTPSKHVSHQHINLNTIAEKERIKQRVIKRKPGADQGKRTVRKLLRRKIKTRGYLLNPNAANSNYKLTSSIQNNAFKNQSAPRQKTNEIQLSAGNPIKR